MNARPFAILVGVLALLLGGAGAWLSQPLAVVAAACLMGTVVLHLARSRTAPVPPAGPGQGSGGGGAVLAAIPAPVLIVDRRVVVLAANAAAHAAVPGVAPGQPLAFALRAPEVLDGIRAVVAGGTGRQVEFGGRGRRDPVWRVTLQPLGTGGAADAAPVLLFFQDLSAERRLDTMRSDFVATASHELRTPLASILGFIETLQGPAREDAAARARFLVVMRDQAERMRRLLDDLLRLSRVEMHAHQAPDGTVALRELLQEVLEMMAPLARERGVELRADLGPREIAVKGDRDELIRVAENLLENACRYGGRVVEVTLGPAGDDRYAVFAVRDEGPGIAPEHLPRLTERFYRVDVQDSRAQGGTGLGLAIVKHIVARHRGRLEIDSEPGRGATFRVRLPGGPA